MKTLGILFLSLICLSVRAESLTLPTRQVDELSFALQKLGVGLSGANAVKATRDLIALRPIAEAYAAGIKAELANHKIGPTTKADSPEAMAYTAAVEKLGGAPVKIDLQLFKISDEEFERLSANTPPAILEIVVRHLEPKSKP